MTATSLATAAAWSYGFALVFYAGLAIRMALGWKPSPRAAALIFAVLATTAWAAACIFFGTAPNEKTLLATNVTDMLRYAGWFGFIASVLRGAAHSDHRETNARVRRLASFGVLLALIAALALSDALPLTAILGWSGRVEFGIRLGLAVFGLALVEQLYRRAHAQARWAIKPLCFALIGMFGYDLFLYADSMLFGRMDADIWVARGVTTALVVPLIAIATARNDGWTIEMHLSRGAVFHSTALLVSGVFLLVVAAAGYIVRYLGGDWGRALQIEFIFGGLLALVLIATSGSFRSRLKVFISKHFFSYRYDYREEWLRFTRTLSTDVSSQNVQERTIIALAGLVESPAGVLWLKDDLRGFVLGSRWNMPALDVAEPANSSLSRFLTRTGWIVNLPERAADPSQYPDLEPPTWLAALPRAWLIVPLVTGTELIGFVVLGAPRAKIEVNWEVRDLLKTASRQAAGYLAQIRASEALLEARKFEAFNRMSAFVVHDLKNLVAQLSLMLRNAERHRNNPEFQRDMLMTVEHVVGRMNGLMLQLRTSAAPVENPRSVELEPLIRRICAAKTGARSPIALDLGAVSGLGHEERLEHVIGHLVQNALDATANSGDVSVRLAMNGKFASIDVIDTGIGMPAEFVRERLFKPFETTKGTGMGIGVYESAQYIRSLGGDIRVESAPGTGTSVHVLLPRADAPFKPEIKSEVA
ncbi:MAG TPA: XrtA/PEP-CTERM system histidine kinase PrsK [Casimicrobiaceae bacterium]